MRNWRRDIRASSEPSILIAQRTQTPQILKTLNNRTRALKKKQFYRDELEWIAYYNKLVDEYHKIEEEINGLNLEHNIHSQIKHHRNEYEKWIQSITQIISKFHSNDSDLSKQQIESMLDEKNEELNAEQHILDKEIKQFQKNLNSSTDGSVSIRKENVRFYEFCMEHDIRSSDVCGGWNEHNHQKYVMLTQQHKALAFNKLYARIKQYFPDQNKHQMKTHHEWYRLYLQHIATNKRMKKEKRTKHKMLVKRTKSLNLIENSRSRLEMAEQEEKQRFDSKKNDLHQQMDEIGQIRKEQIIQKRIQNEKESEQLRLKEIEARNEWNEYRNEQKIQLNEYNNAQNIKLQQIKNEQMKQQKKERIKKRELGKINIKRVMYRDKMRDEMIQKQKESLKDKEEEQRMREMRLSKLRLSVKQALNQNKINEIGGLHKETKNVINRLKEHENERKEMFVHNGYSDEKLFEDPRFELMNHLISNNLHKSKYAKQCLKNTNSAIKPRKDCNHSDLFNS